MKIRIRKIELEAEGEAATALLSALGAAIAGAMPDAPETPRATEIPAADDVPIRELVRREDAAHREAKIIAYLKEAGEPRTPYKIAIGIGLATSNRHLHKKLADMRTRGLLYSDDDGKTYQDVLDEA